MKQIKMRLNKKPRSFFAFFLAAVFLCSASVPAFATAGDLDMEGYDLFPIPKVKNVLSYADSGTKQVNTTSIITNNDEDSLVTVQGLTDSSLVSGITYSADKAGTPHAFIIKTKTGEDGSLIPDWMQTLYSLTTGGGSNPLPVGLLSTTTARFTGTAQLTDGSYIATGYITITGNISASYRNKTYTADLSDLDGNVYPISISTPNSTLKPRLFLAAHLSSEGKIDWIETLDDRDNTEPYSVRPTAGGGFVTILDSSTNELDFSKFSALPSFGKVIVQYQPKDGGGFEKTLFEKIASDNSSLWGYTNDVLPTYNQAGELDGYLVAGQAYGTKLISSADTGKQVSVNNITMVNQEGAGIVYKLDTQGKILWTVQGEASRYLGLAQGSDGNYVAAGLIGDISFTGSTTADARIMKFSSQGDLIKEKSLGSSSKSGLVGTASTADGGYLFTGFVRSGFTGGEIDDLTSGITPSSGNDYSFVVKTDSDLTIQGVYYVAGGVDNGDVNYRRIASTANGFRLAGRFNNNHGVFTDAVNSTADFTGFVATFTYDSDGDGVTDDKDYYIYDPSRFLAPDAVPGETFILAGNPVKLTDVAGLDIGDANAATPFYNQATLSFNGATLTAPVTVFNKLFAGSGDALTFSYASNSTVFDVGTNLFVGAFDLSMVLGETTLTDFGAQVSVTVPVSGITDTAKAKLFYVDGGALRLVQGADFSTPGYVTFPTTHFSTYVVAQALPDADPAPISGGDDNPPADSSSGGGPITGDGQLPAVWLMLGSMALSVVVLLRMTKRKKTN